eukprot:s3161_g3.t1
MQIVEDGIISQRDRDMLTKMNLGWTLSRNNLSYLFYLASDETARFFYTTSCKEVAAYLNFVDSGDSDPYHHWDELTDDQCSAWIPDEPAWEFIKGLREWRTDVCWTGWPVLCECEFEYLPTWRPVPAMKPVDRETMERIQAIIKIDTPEVTFDFDKPSLEGDLVRHVMSIYDSSWVPISLNTRTNQATVMHGLAHAVSWSWGKHWARDIVLMSWTQKERHDQFTLFPQARLFLVVLHSEHHWALLVILRARMWAVCFDGQSNEGILKASTETAEFFGKQWNGEIKLQFARVPPQLDEWSCGQRTILYGDFALTYLKDHHWLKLPLTMPKENLEEKDIVALLKMKPFVPPTETEDEEDEVCPPQPAATHSAPHQEPEGRPSKKAKTDSAAPRATKRAREKEQEAGDQSTKPNQKKNAKVDELKALEKKLLEEKKFSHNIDFQKQHRSKNLQPKRGHWQEFLRQIINQKPMSCVACQACKEIIDAPRPEAPTEEAQQEEPAPPPQPQPQREDAGRKRGRPRKNATSSWEGLAPWMEKHRPGIYSLVDEEEKTWLCRLCNVELRLQRDGITYVEMHEGRKTHKQKVEVFKNSLPQDEQPKAAPFAPCKGALIDDEKLIPDLYAIRYSILNFVQGGMPFATGDSKNCPLLQVAFTFHADGLHFKHKDCTSEASPVLCNHCFQLSRNQILISDLKHWSWRLDQVQLCQLKFVGTIEEINEQIEVINLRDYYVPEVHRKEVSMLNKMNGLDAMNRVRWAITSIPRNKRNASLQALVDTRLSDVRDLCPRNMEKSVFLTMLRKYQSAIESGQCHEDEFQLAAQIATGKLRNEPLVECLFKSAMAKMCKLEKGATQRPCTSKFVNSEMALELLVVLGRGKAAQNVLQPLEC